MGGQPEALTRSLRVGAKLRAARTNQKISMREMSRRVGVSASFMSQVERDLTAPSVGTLYNIVSELGLSLDEVMGAEVSATSPQSSRLEPLHASATSEATEVAPLPEKGTLSGLQRSDSRAEIVAGGVLWERLTPEDDPHVEFLRVTYRSGSESCPPDNLSNHGGKEYIHILSGALEIQVAFARQVLHPGDSLNFDSSIPHRLCNPFEQDCVALWVVVGRQ